MKIAIWHNLLSGGGKRALYYHVKGLLKQGHHVEIWCPDTADPSYLPLSQLAKEHTLPLKEELEKIDSKKNLTFFHGLKRRINAVKRHCKSCADYIHKGGFDVLMANSCSIFYMSHIGPFVNIPKAIYLAEPFRPLYEASPKLPWVALDPITFGSFSLRTLVDRLRDASKVYGYRLQVREELYAATSYDLILVNSRYSRESVLRAYGLESKVCYLGTDTDLFKKTSRQRDNYVVGMGVIHHSKGIDRAIRAISTIPEKVRPSLIWIANGSFKETEIELYELAISLNVDFIPKLSISDKEITDILSRAAVLVYTSRLEPFGLAPLEANACGTAVVGIAEGGIRESVKHGVNGVLTDDEDPETLGKALLNFTQNLDYAGEFGDRARDHVLEKWNLTRAVDQLEKNLASLVN